MPQEFDDLDELLSSDSKPIVDVRGSSSRKPVDPVEELDMNREFLYALDIMSNTNDSLFLTGEAGTGKSTLVKHFMRNTKKRAVVLAPTGVAAVNAGGQTVHSFFKFPPKPLTDNNIPMNVSDDNMRLYNAVDTIIIDEVSMVRVDMMDAIDTFLRIHLNDNAPFAGKQIIMVGDLNQLPPVIGSSAEREMITHGHKSEFFFDAAVFERSTFHKVALTRIYRQKDPVFISYLNKIRNGSISYIEIDELNTRCHKPSRLNPEVVNICTTNAVADYLNSAHLEDVKSEEIVLPGKIEGQFNTKNCPVGENIKVKIGCRVMILVNDPDKKYYNGTIGILEEVNEGEEPSLVVNVGGSRMVISPYTYESKAYTYNPSSKTISTKSIGTFKQYPVRLAYAITAHKAQGLTFDRINIDLGYNAFAHGQSYIAISRCRTLEGVTFSRPFRKSDIIIDKRVAEFMSTFKSDIS